MAAAPDDLNSLWLRTTSRERVLRALEEDARGEGQVPVEPSELAPYGRWLHGEEDPTVRRYAVAPPRGGWTGVFPSQPDWDHERAPALAERLGCLAVSLMLHDGDVLTLHLHDGPRLIAAHVSSPVHFDDEPRPEGVLDVRPEALLRACRPGVGAEEVVRALTPPGRIDVDGRRAHAAMAELLALGPAGGLTYALLVAADGVSLRPEHAELAHVAFRLEDEAGEPPRARVLRFPGGAADPT